MSEKGYKELVAHIREVMNVILGASDGSPSRAAFHLVLKKVPEQEREQLVSGLNAMMQDPGNVIRYRDVVTNIPQKLIGVSPELRNIRKLITESVPCGMG